MTFKTNAKCMGCLAKIEEIYKIKDVKNISLKINEMLDFVKKEIKKML